MIVDAIIPAFNEEGNVKLVLDDLAKTEVRHVFLVDNNSTDATAQRAQEAGAVVLQETFQGYGAACLKGIAETNLQSPPPDIVVFLDADYSDDIASLPRLIAPVISGAADMVIGSRALGKRDKGAMTPQQRFGNWLATKLMRLFYGIRFTDLGPFRAISLDALNRIDMQDKTYGWTVEMQVKAVKNGLKCQEIAVDYHRRRTGKSKVAGTLKGTILAGYKIIATILRHI